MFIELKIAYRVWQLERLIRENAIKGYEECVISKRQSYCPKVINILKSKGYQIEEIRPREEWYEPCYQVNLRQLVNENRMKHSKKIGVLKKGE